MDRGLRRRFWLEGALAVLSGVLLVLTLVTREWIELIFGVDPDHGSGALEAAVVGALLATTAVLFVVARREYLRARPA
jgi:hypothetical protein